MYGDSSSACVSLEFPEHAWKFWNFERLPEGWWSNHLAPLFNYESASNDTNTDIVSTTVVRQFMEDLAETYSVSELAEWYRVSLRNLGTTTIARMRHLGGIANVLWKLYPYHLWEFTRFTNTGKRGTQRDVFAALKIGFPDEGAEANGTILLFVAK